VIKQRQLKFKIGVTGHEITPRAGPAISSKFLRGFGIKSLIQKHMPAPGSNRGYEAWGYLEPLIAKYIRIYFGWV